MKTPAKSLVLLLLCAGFDMSPAQAARKCPSGQILRVSLGICVPKEQNLSVVRQHSQPTKQAEDVVSAPSKKPAEKDVANAGSPPPTAERADHESVAATDKLSAAAESKSSPLSPFGQLFVGAFHSTVSTGLSAFR